MSMSRRHRRAQKRLRLVGADEQLPPAAPPREGETPVERFALDLDAMLRAYQQKHPALDGMSMCSTLLQFAAALGVEVGCPAEEFAGAAGQIFEREAEARSGRSGA